MLTVIVKTMIDKATIADLLIAAMEGGSNYWASVYNLDKESINFKNTRPEDMPYAKIAYPMNEGGEICIKDKKTEKKNNLLYLNLHGIKRAFKRMAKASEGSAEYRALQNILKDNWDANDADVFFQLCFFKQTIYG